MDPIISWLVCLLSAFLLAAGGFLFARALAARNLSGRLQDLSTLNLTLRQTVTERDEARNRIAELEAKINVQEAAIASQFEAMDQDGFGGATQLPDPQSYFEQDRHSVPNLEQLADGEFEIAEAAPPSALEAADGRDDGLDHQDKTKQFNLHSPEAVVQFMQRIDELTDENRDLMVLLEDRDEEIKEKRAEGSEYVHRAAALDATNDKLRAQLQRRSERIRHLEEQLTQGAPPLDVTKKHRLVLDPPQPPALSRAGLAAGLRGPHDGPTLQVQRLDEDELTDAGAKDGE